MNVTENDLHVRMKEEEKVQQRDFTLCYLDILINLIN